MPILQQAKKAKRVADRKAVVNLRVKRAMKSAIKEIHELVLSGNAQEAYSKLGGAYKVIDKAAKQGVIKDNTASRKKSRLSAFIKKALQ